MYANAKHLMLTHDTVSLEALLECTDSPLLDEARRNGSETVENGVFRRLCIKDIYAALALLPEHQRQVLVLSFGLNGHHKLSVPEIAWRLGENQTWVILTARKALSHLRREYGRQLEGYLEIAA